MTKRNKQLACILLGLLIISSLSLMPLVTSAQKENEKPDQVKLRVEIVSRNVLFKGDYATILVTSNNSQVQLSITDSQNKIVFMALTFGLFYIIADPMGWIPQSVYDLIAWFSANFALMVCALCFIVGCYVFLQFVNRNKRRENY